MKKIYILIAITAFSLAGNAQCNDWLNITGQKSGVEIGDLDITGDSITIEAEFDRNEPYVGGSESYEGDIVSKHTNRLDCNYLLRPDEAEITTNVQWYMTPYSCDMDTGKTYHVALVYDGDSLKFYRNGYLMTAIPASGTLVTNNWNTTFGTTADLSNPDVTGLLGYINEVRIWKVARTQAQLRQYMNIPLPNPTTQTGLLAYYQFNSLTNLQGNPAWNGTIISDATINATNPTCAAFVADSCDIVTPLVLKGFQGAVVNQSTVLSWTTFDEVNTASDVVERSYDGVNFVAAGSLPAKGSLQVNNYQFTDHPSFANAEVFYRLKLIDKDGKFTYSNVLVFSLGKQTGVKLFPNPAKNYVQLTYGSSKYESTTIEVTDISGKIVLTQSVSTALGTNAVTLNFQNKLVSGTYIVRFVVNGEMVVNKVVVE